MDVFCHLRNLYLELEFVSEICIFFLYNQKDHLYLIHSFLNNTQKLANSFYENLITNIQDYYKLYQY